MNRLISTSSGKVKNISQVTSYHGGFTLSSGHSLSHYFVKYIMHNITALDRKQSCFDNSTVCDKDNEFYCVAGQCTRSRTHYQAAYNEGLEWDYTANKWKVMNSNLPIWTESRWKTLRMRLYKSSSVVSEGLQFGVGLCLTALTSLVCVYVRKPLVELVTR